MLILQLILETPSDSECAPALDPPPVRRPRRASHAADFFCKPNSSHHRPRLAGLAREVEEELMPK